MNRKQVREYFNAQTEEKKAEILETLAKPWIENKAIKEVPKDINIILDLQFKTIETLKKIKPISK